MEKNAFKFTKVLGRNTDLTDMGFDQICMFFCKMKPYSVFTFTGHFITYYLSNNWLKQVSKQPIYYQGSEFSINNRKAWIHPAGVMVWGIVS